MQEKILLNKKEVIVFMGTMNAMPMMYALELKEMGYEVIYFVDVNRKNMLSRPENHFPGIDYPYPSWIVEMTLPSQILLAIFPKYFAWRYKNAIKKITKKNVGVFFLNGFFASLAPYLFKSANKVGLSHGSDMDVWADVDSAEVLAKSFKSRSIFKYLPAAPTVFLIKKILANQYDGYRKSNVLVYFPMGFNSSGDKIVRRLVDEGVRYVPRYDISFEPLRGQPREFKAASESMQIFCGVRFLYKTFPDGNEKYNKGNDLIIEGIARYFSRNKNIQVHFVEKGEDVAAARDLCQQLGLSQIVVWHKEMPFNRLLELYKISDVCFDQLGEHWIGAIGGYALWLGKPLIANAESAVRTGIWPSDNPVCSASTACEVFDWLVKMENQEFRMQRSINSKKFVENYMAPTHALKQIFNFFE